ncbi:Uncharacterized protein FWK35_00003114 [Aphis craccivora]|uniref:Uncharacterized protein n=1 Tax=Aphis craccivora TaxID=307492 RepID=A0A6G0ZR83_APHCR|nr:Uncharacterized protein FWK35_00003114 [Aphis craccivora]
MSQLPRIRPGHARRFCGHRPRCVKCGGDHLTSECSKDSSCPAKCALCRGDHMVNFKECSSFKTLRKNQSTYIPFFHCPKQN